jgi:hypothetical protein
MRIDELLQKSEPWKEILNKLQDNSRFQSWFKNSTVVDNKGAPLIVYHSGEGNWKLPKPFTHFGTATAARMRYKYKRSMEVNDDFSFTKPFLLSIQNPMIIKDTGMHVAYNFASIIEKEWPEIDIMTKLYNKTPIIPNSDIYQIIRKILETKGIDGFSYKNEFENRGSTSYIILRPAQAMPLFKLAKLVL